MQVHGSGRHARRALGRAHCRHGGRGRTPHRPGTGIQRPGTGPGRRCDWQTGRVEVPGGFRSVRLRRTGTFKLPALGAGRARPGPGGSGGRPAVGPAESAASSPWAESAVPAVRPSGWKLIGQIGISFSRSVSSGRARGRAGRV